MHQAIAEPGKKAKRREPGRTRGPRHLVAPAL
jgi:hypothetical protein